MQNTRRVPTASEWERFDFYARRVKKLGFFQVEHTDRQMLIWSDVTCGGYRVGVMPKFAVALLIARRTEWLLPNLEQIRLLRHDTLVYLPLLPALIGPRVTSVCFADYFSVDPWPAEYFGRLEPIANQIIGITCTRPLVTDLEVHVHEQNIVADAAIQFAYACPRLEGFVVYYADPWPVPFLQYLARQQFLKKVFLKLDCEVSENMNIFRDATPHYPFPSLQCLDIHVPDISACTTLIQIMNTTRLHTLHVALIKSATASQVGELFAALDAHCSHATLQVVEIVQDRDIPQILPSKDDIFDIRHLRPLLRFPHIRALILWTALVYEFDDDAICEIADAWPAVVYLSIYDHWAGTTTPKVTWSAIAYLLSRCPQLHELIISFNSTKYGAAQLVLPPSFRPHRHLYSLGSLRCVVRDSTSFSDTLFSLASRVLEVKIPFPIFSGPEESGFAEKIENTMWELRRTRLRDEFGFLDEYGTFPRLNAFLARLEDANSEDAVLSEAEQMNGRSPPKPFPWGKASDGRWFPKRTREMRVEGPFR